MRWQPPRPRHYTFVLSLRMATCPLYKLVFIHPPFAALKLPPYPRYLTRSGVGVTLCCPGPVATGSQESPRVVYGPKARIVQNATGSSNRLDPARAAHLIANAAAHGVDEAWIARHPVLAMGESEEYDSAT